LKAIRTGVPAVFEFRLDGAKTTDRPPVCGGVAKVLVDPTISKHRLPYALAGQALARREGGILVTRLRLGRRAEVSIEFHGPGPVTKVPGQSGAKDFGGFLAEEKPHLFLESFDLQPMDAHRGHEPGGAALLRRHSSKAAQQRSPTRSRSRFLEGAMVSGFRSGVFIEAMLPPPLLLIVGGGHVGQALAWLAHAAGFDIAVIEDRPDFARRELFPEGAVIRRGAVVDELKRFPVASDTYIVIVTRSHNMDAAALAACLGRPCAYLGMIGSERKVAALKEEFLTSGKATAAEWRRVTAPIGLNIGAVSVPEIAVSIVAQLIAVRHKKAGGRMRRA
jgi:xanthine dehydrogenase accessory factor